MVFRDKENNDQVKGNNIALDDHVCLRWDKFKIDKLPLPYKSVFDLLNFIKNNSRIQIDGKDLFNYNCDLSEIDTIVALRLTVDPGEDCRENISNALKYISKYFSLASKKNIIAVYLDLPNFDDGNNYNIEEEYFPIPESITNRNYQISNYGNVLDENGNMVERIYYDDGPRVPIFSDSGNVCLSYYSVPYLMMTVFHPILDAGENQKMTKIAARFAKLLECYANAGYKDISAYCGLSDGKMLIYTDSDIGRSLVNAAEYIESCI